MPGSGSRNSNVVFRMPHSAALHSPIPVGISIDYTFQVKAKLPQLKKPRKAGKKGKKS